MQDARCKIRPVYFLLAVMAVALMLPVSGWSAVSSDDLQKEITGTAKPMIDAGHYDEAIAYCERMVAAHPDKPYPYSYLGIAYYGKGDLETAEKNLKLAIDIDTFYAEAYYYLALIEYKKGDIKKVIDYLNEVTSLDGNFQIAYYNKGVAFLTTGMPKRAMKEFAYALYLEPVDNQSLAGLLKAAEELKMIEIDKSAEQAPAPEAREELAAIMKSPESLVSPHDEDVAGMRPIPGFSVPRPETAGSMKLSDVENTQGAVERVHPAETPPARAQDETRPEGPAFEAGKEMRTFLSTALSKEEIIFDADKEIAIKSLNRCKGALEISYSTPRDLSSSKIGFEVKGGEGGENFRIVMRDSSTKRSPGYDCGEAVIDWKPIDIDARDAGKGIDLSHVENIKIEILPSPDASKENMSLSVRRFVVE